jgi:hypothetical protein
MGLPELTPFIVFGLLIVGATYLGGIACDTAAANRKNNS